MNKTTVEHRFVIGDTVYVLWNYNQVIKAVVRQIEIHITEKYTDTYYRFDIRDEDEDEKSVMADDESVFATANEAFAYES